MYEIKVNIVDAFVLLGTIWILIEEPSVSLDPTLKATNLRYKVRWSFDNCKLISLLQVSLQSISLFFIIIIWSAYTMSRALRCSRTGVAANRNDFVIVGRKRMRSTSKTNDGFEIVPFHTPLPHWRGSRGMRGGGRERWWAMAAKTFSISPTISCVITDVVWWCFNDRDLPVTVTLGARVCCGRSSRACWWWQSDEMEPCCRD